MSIELFPKDKVIGSFKGYAESGHEFAADLVIPYRSEDINKPQFGSFLLVKLSASDKEQATQATLGRITKVLPLGRLAEAEGEDYIERMRERKELIDPEIKKRMIRYRVRIKLLGVLRVVKDKLDFKPSQRRLPHLGALVGWPSDEVLKDLCMRGEGETEIGHFALGEFIYDNKKSTDEEGVHLSPALPVTFNVHNLVAKRTAVFARAGYGKSNLMKYLVSELYKKPPKTKNGRPVGMLIFDADGEYFWPQNETQPGLCDVSDLRDTIAVFSRRPAPDKHYEKWLGGNVKMDIRELNSRDVFSIALAPDRQEQQNVLKLKAIRGDNWRRLVDLIEREGMGADSLEVGKLLGYKTDEQIKGAFAEINAATSNANFVINMLHEPDSKFLSGVLDLLSNGNIVVVDVSLLSAKGGEILAGLLMRKIFSNNQENFLRGNHDKNDSNSRLIPVIAVIEEAQRTLGGNLDETSPFVEWVKEGRKYDLGAVMVTQQPGALAGELLSQVDNWFCFHVLSKGDASVLEKYNSHFSEDICSHMIAEPIIGNCFMWSAPSQPFVLPVRVHQFKTSGKKTPPKRTVRAKIEKDAEKRQSEMARLFREAVYRQGRMEFNLKGVQLKGVKSGNLYFLIKGILEKNPHLQGAGRVDDYKLPLMRELFGEITVLKDDSELVDISSVGDNSDYYYCASEKEWNKIFSDKSGK